MSVSIRSLTEQNFLHYSYSRLFLIELTKFLYWPRKFIFPKSFRRSLLMARDRVILQLKCHCGSTASHNKQRYTKTVDYHRRCTILFAPRVSQLAFPLRLQKSRTRQQLSPLKYALKTHFDTYIEKAVWLNQLSPQLDIDK